MIMSASADFVSRLVWEEIGAGFELVLLGFVGDGYLGEIQGCTEDGIPCNPGEIGEFLFFL